MTTKKSTKSEKPAAPQVQPVTKKAVEPAPAKKTVAPKKVPTPKKATSASAPAPVRVVATSPASTPAALAVTTLVAQVNVGFGNQLFVRGEGAGLSWEAGTLMTCVADDRWTLTLTGAVSPVLFKFVLNDHAWSTGGDFSVAPGDTAVVSPTF